MLVSLLIRINGSANVLYAVIFIANKYDLKNLNPKLVKKKKQYMPYT